MKTNIYIFQYITTLLCVFLAVFAATVKGANVSREMYEADQKFSRLFNESKYRDALPVAKRLVELNLKELGECGATAVAYCDLGDTYARLGDMGAQLECSKKSLEIMRRKYGENSQNYADALFKIFCAYMMLDDYSNAKQNIDKAYDITKTLYGENHWKTASILSQKGVLSSTMGDRQSSLQYYLKSYDILKKEREKRKIPNDILEKGDFTDKIHDEQNITDAYDTVLESLTNCNIALKHFDDALTWARKRLDYTQSLKEPSGTYYANALKPLAECLLGKKEYVEAEEVLKKLLAFWNSREQEYFHQGEAWGDIGDLYFEQQRYKEALECFSKGIELWKMGRYGDRTDIYWSYQRTLCFKAIGNVTEAENITLLAVRQINNDLQSALLLSEKERLGWQSNNLDTNTAIAIATLKARDAHDCLIKWKGVVLGSLMEDRVACTTVEGRQNIEKLHNLKKQLDAIQDRASPSGKSDFEKINREIADTEIALARVGTKYGRRRSAQQGVSEVLPHMPNDSVLVDLVKFKDAFPPYNSQYGVFILKNDETDQFISLGSAAEIEEKVTTLNQVIRANDEGRIADALSYVSKQVWEPIARSLTNAPKIVIICPDGLLNFVSFAALQDTDGRFLAEKYEIVYVGSGRDLASPAAKDHNKQIALFANPVFDLSAMSTATNPLAMRSAEMAEFGQIILPQLPGTEVEGKSLIQEAEKEGWAATAYFGDKATELQIRTLKKPGILHLSTHGFYLNAFTPSDDNTRGMKLVGLDQNKPVQNSGKGVDPMRASGIALTGAQTTLKAWSEGKAPGPENDGVLTAEEVAGLDLEGTWLVTLSACETGVGEIKSGEGVFGLRRAFMMAGAQNLLMTLWPVSDVTTADIMKDFYHRALATDDAPRALADTQRDWLVKLQKEKGLLAAVRDAGPFIMTTMGALPAHATFSAPQKSNFLR